MRLLAIDPGNERSAFVLIDKDYILNKGILPNEELIEFIYRAVWPNENQADHLAIEMIASYGMAVGAEVFETCLWIGRFIQAFEQGEVTKVYRKDVKLHLCGSPRAKDGNIRQALIDRYGGPEAIQPKKLCPRRKNKSHSELCPTCGGMGTIQSAGVLFGFSSDMWSALAVAVTYKDSLVTH